MEELQTLNNLRVWRIKSKKLQKNDDNISYGIWDWAKRNKNYKDLLEELKVDKLTNEEIFSEFFEKSYYFQEFYSKSSIPTSILNFIEKSDEIDEDNKFVFKCQIIYANEI